MRKRGGTAALAQPRDVVPVPERPGHRRRRHSDRLSEAGRRSARTSRHWKPKCWTTGTRDDTFRASIARRDGAPEYVFYDGPPFANGLPHYGHLLTGYVKDIVPRYRTMRGYKVERRFGWDTHGLPAELEVQRQLGITDKAQIEEMGIEKFNDACRASVLKYTDEWRAYVTRQARWVDFDNDYKTLDLGFMESVIWAFKQLWDKGLAYEGYRVLPYCWNDETPLSSHELRMDDDVYQSRQDPAITVGFRVGGGRSAGRRLPAGLDDHAVDAAVQPGRRGQSRGRPTSQVQGPTAGATCWPRPGWRAYARELGEEPEVVGTYIGPGSARHALPAAVPVLHGLAQRLSGAAGRLRHHRGRHRHRAHGAGLRRGRHGDHRRRGHRRRHAGRLQGPLRRDGARLRGPARLRRQPADHPRPEEQRRLRRRQRGGAAAPRDLRALLPALLAVPKPVDLPGGVVVVHQGHRVPRPHGGTQPADHLVSRARQGRPVRQVAAGCPRLVDLAKPLLGHARFRCGSPTIRPIRASTCTAASTSSSATSGCGRQICTGPTSTS